MLDFGRTKEEIKDNLTVKSIPITLPTIFSASVDVESLAF